MATSPRFTEAIYPTPTYSLAASPARTSARPESEPGLKALAAAFGLSSPVSLGRLDLGTSSLRTSQASLFTTECEELSESFPDAGMWGYGDVYELQSSAPVTCESESSLWPTANTKDAASAARHTTTTGIMHPGTTLTDAIRMWPTPTEDNANNCGGPSRTKGTYSDLTVEVSHWTTPQAHDGMGGPRTAEQLEQAKALNKGGNCNLSTDAVIWRTPDASMAKSAQVSVEDRMQNPDRQIGLQNQANHWECPSHPAPQIPDGLKSSPSDRTSRRLSPRFVEWLMGFPLSWTEL